MLFHRVERCQELRRNIERDPGERTCVQTAREGTEGNGTEAAKACEVKNTFFCAQGCA